MKNLFLAIWALGTISAHAGSCNLKFTDHISGESKSFIGDSRVGKEVEGFGGITSSKDPIIKTQNYEITVVQQGREPGLVINNLKLAPKLRFGSIYGETYLVFGKSLEFASLNERYDLSMNCKR
jgi:hypothetical protein